LSLSKIASLVLLGLVAVSSLVVVDTGDVAVVYRFGAVDRTLGAGLGLRAPWPIEQHEVVGVSEVRRSEPGPRRMLTGDTNLVDVDLIIQYRVADPVAFQLGMADAEETLAGVVFAVTKDRVATMGVDVLLTTGRTELQQGAAQSANELLERLSTGLRVDAVEVREITPPPDVLDAFKEVSSARGDRETLALAAEAYASKRLPQVRGSAAEEMESAKTFAADRAAQTSGDVSRFQEFLEAKRAAPRAVRAQLWLETARAVGERVEVMPLRDGTEVRVSP
jgi:membrane protease subunit HflK